MDPADDDGAGKKNGDEEPEFSASAFEALERDFQEVSMPRLDAAHRPAHAGDNSTRNTPTHATR